MTQSIVIVGPRGCGKTINAPGFCKAFGLSKWADLEDLRHHRKSIPVEDYIIFSPDWPENLQGMQCVNFYYAIQKVEKPHPMTPKIALPND